MSKLSETNPYLRDPDVRARMLLRSVASSSAVEGIRKPFTSGRAVAIAAARPKVAQLPGRGPGAEQP